MSEDLSSSEPSLQGRIRKSSRGSSDASDGGSKTILIVAAVLIVVLAFVLYRRNSSANAQAEADAKAMASLSNDVTILRTKLALEVSTAGVAQSNHQATLDHRTAEFLTLSNRLGQISLLLEQAQQSKQAAQNELADKTAAMATVEAQQEEMRRQITTIPELQREAAELNARLYQASGAQASLNETLGRTRLELADLHRQLQDPNFLRLQEKRAQEAAELRQRAAAHRRIDTSDPRVRLELQPDGTVRSAIATVAPPRK